MDGFLILTQKLSQDGALMTWCLHSSETASIPVTWQLTAYRIQSTHQDVVSDVEFGTIHVAREPLHQNVPVPVENVQELLQNLEMEAGSQDLAVNFPLLTCKTLQMIRCGKW
jgi:hypothetical protein